MALYACAETFWILFAKFFAYFLANWLFVLLTFVIVGALFSKLSNLIIGIFAFIIDASQDYLLVGTFGLSFSLTILGSFAVGVLWALMVYKSNTNILIKIPNMICIFLFALLWGILPLPFPLPIAPIVGYLLENFEVLNYFIGFFSLGFLYLASFLALPFFGWVCSSLNLALNFF